MSLFFALVLIGLPAAALIYDFRKGGNNTMLTPQMAGTPMATSRAVPPQRPKAENPEEGV